MCCLTLPVSLAAHLVHISEERVKPRLHYAPQHLEQALQSECRSESKAQTLVERLHGVHGGWRHGRSTLRRCTILGPRYPIVLECSAGIDVATEGFEQSLLSTWRVKQQQLQQFAHLLVLS